MSDTKKEEERKRFTVAEKFLTILAIHTVTPKSIKDYVFESFKNKKDWIEKSTPFTTLAKAVGATAAGTPGAESFSIVDIIDKIPGAVGDQIHKVCFGNEDCKSMVSRETLGNLAIVGIPLAIYLYVKFKGTDEEKENMETKLREARRMTEETSDRRMKRRRTNKLRELSETEIPMSMSEVKKRRRADVTEIPMSTNKETKRRQAKSSASPRGLKQSLRHRKSPRKHQ